MRIPLVSAGRTRSTPRTSVAGVIAVVLVFCSMGLIAAPVSGQATIQLPTELRGLSLGGEKLSSSHLSTSAQIRWAPDGKTGLLQVTAAMERGWHVYSMTQPPGGPMKSAIRLDPNRNYRVLGSFAPNRPASVHHSPEFGLSVEEYEGEVTWSVPLELAEGGTAEGLKILGELTGQVCSPQGGCFPLNLRPEAKFTAEAGPPLSEEEARGLVGSPIPNCHARVRSWLDAAQVVPGGIAMLHLAVEPEAGWHVYAHEPVPSSPFDHPTLFALDGPPDWKLGKIQTIAPTISEKHFLPDAPPVQYHESPVTWTLPIQVPTNSGEGPVELAGMVGLQTCSRTCDLPTGFRWKGQLHVTTAPVAPSPKTQLIAKIEFDPQSTSYEEVLKRIKPDAGSPEAGGGKSPSPNEVAAPGSVVGQGFDPAKLQRHSQGELKLPMALLSAFLGGFVLNFMPCVLPVIGLKVLSFVEQSGKNRSKTFMLNVWYALGILVVFWILATLAAAPAWGGRQFGWGQQFNYDEFTIPLIAVVFVMALSFFGIWEIPIPGFATSQTATQLADRGGYEGAFFKGMITTLLATPCSAPYLATAYAWAVASKSVPLSYLIFTLMGIGMSFPYLLIGAFPRLVRFLPRPGAWMETFKNLMGFLLLGTVVYLLTVIDWIHIVPTVALLFGLWFACWWIGSVPLTAEPDKRLRAWIASGIIAVLAITFSFANRFDFADRTFYGLRGAFLDRYARSIDKEIVDRRLALASIDSPERPASHSPNELPWEPYSPALLDQLTREGYTVVIDFTASWCFTCKTLEQTVLNTRTVREVVDQNQIRTLVADWSDQDPAISNLMIQLQGVAQVPTLAIFPAGRPNEPVVLSSGYTQNRLLKLLEQAGPSQGATGAKAKVATAKLP